MITDPWFAAIPRVGLMEYRFAVPTELNVEQAAKYLHVDCSTIRNWARAGKIHAKIDNFGGLALVSNDLDQFKLDRPRGSRGGRPLGALDKGLLPGVRSGKKRDGSLIIIALEDGGVLRCKCDCGNVIELTNYEFRFRLICERSCPTKKRSKGGPKPNTSFVGNYNKLLRGTRQDRTIPVSLTYTEYVNIRSAGLCLYCNGKLHRQTIGLDRLDNSRGYHADNVVACCGFCNYARGHLLSSEEFRAALAVRRTALPAGSDLWAGYEWHGHTARWRDSAKGER